eukprot:5426566-Pyramimonas_sp.AAC.1
MAYALAGAGVRSWLAVRLDFSLGGSSLCRPGLRSPPSLALLQMGQQDLDYHIFMSRPTWATAERLCGCGELRCNLKPRLPKSLKQGN